MWELLFKTNTNIQQLNDQMIIKQLKMVFYLGRPNYTMWYNKDKDGNI